MYNLAYDICDRHAHHHHHKNWAALYWENEAGKKIQLKFEQVARLSNRFANLLASLTLEKETRILFHLPNIPFFQIAFLGCLKSRILPIPTSTQLTEPELEAILQDSKARVVLTHATQIKKFIPLQPYLDHILVLESPHTDFPSAQYHRIEDLLKNSSQNFNISPTHPNDPAFILYTSGASGKSKGVLHAHRSIPAHDERIEKWHSLKSRQVIFNTSPLNWSYALTSNFLDAWRHGITTLTCDGNLTAEKIIELIKRYHVHTFMSVPGIFRRLINHLEQKPISLPHLKVANSAGESLNPELKEKFLLLTGILILEGLGMTENSVYITERYGEISRPGSCGKPYFPEWVKILDGEIAIHRNHPGLMLGYLNPKGELENPFQGDWFLTRDLAYQDEEGYIFYQGRSDDIFNSGGFKISPLEIENVLNQYPEVQESAVIGKELQPGKTITMAYVVYKKSVDDYLQLKKSILDFCGERLAKYKIPHEIAFVGSLAKTANGKIKRN
ncbi:MAG: acyl-CoA synthetase [Deltaproteobacteria bacterium]|nr:acyl-CoA synthetase [Deltaproteobacteria bacterium]